MKTTILFLMLAAPMFAHAMPCDVASGEVLCKSTSGKYKLSARYCGFDSVVTDFKLSIAGVSQDQAGLGNEWDGDAFQGYGFNIVEDGEKERNVSFEFNRKTGNGTVIDKSRDGNPAPWTTLKKELVHCVVKN